MIVDFLYYPPITTRPKHMIGEVPGDYPVVAVFVIGRATAGHEGHPPPRLLR